MESIQVENVSKSFKIFHSRNSVFEIVRGRSASYEKLDVLKNITFDVKKGETLGIIGSNGSGKTTLLRIIAGIYKPDTGNVSVKGSTIPLLELGIGFHPDLTSIENIIIYGMILGFSKNEIKGKIDEILKFAELEKFRDVKINNFSSGMLSRLAFSTAAHTNPDVLLVDEILAVGDISFREKCYDWFSNFKKNGNSMIWVTHDLGQVSSFCDKALLLHKGEIHSYGDPMEVLKKYKQILGTQ